MLISYSCAGVNGYGFGSSPAAIILGSPCILILILLNPLTSFGRSYIIILHLYCHTCL